MSEHVRLWLQSALLQIDETIRSLQSEQPTAHGSESEDVQSLNDSLESMSSQIREARHRAEQGYSTVHNALEDLESSKDLAESVKHSIVGLAADVKLIEQVIQNVTVIAKRTKVLALNTSILAARAGQMGIAFGVVAREISALSEQSAEIVDSILKQAKAVRERAVQATDKVGKSLRQLMDGIQVSFGAGDALDDVRANLRVAQRNAGILARSVQKVTQRDLPGLTAADTDHRPPTLDLRESKRLIASLRLIKGLINDAVSELDAAS